MKFLCIECDARMSFEQREVPGDGTLAAVFRCESCGRSVAMLTNPMETQLVSSLGVEIGGREVPAEPMASTREALREPRVHGAEGDSAEESESPSPGAGSPPGSAGARAGAGSERAARGQSADGGDGPDAGGRVRWTEAAVDRLGRVPSFVRGMVRRIYTDYARERGIREITPEVMDRARSDLGLEGM